MPREVHRSLDAQLRRKVNKPLVERKRRERINKYLNELHGLLTESGNPAAANKLEKADILEMAVNHIKNIKSQIALKQAERRLQVSRLSHPPTPAQESLKVMIPCRPYSPANSESSLNSDYLSPPAAAYNSGYPNRLPQTNPAAYQGTVLPVKGGGYAVLIHNQKQNSLQSANQYQYQNSHQNQDNTLYRPQPTCGVPVINHSVPNPARNASPVWRPW